MCLPSEGNYSRLSHVTDLRHVKEPCDLRRSQNRMPNWPAQFCPSLTEVSHVTWRGVPLEMTGGTKGIARRARTLKAWARRGGSPLTATPIYYPSKGTFSFCLSNPAQTISHCGFQVLRLEHIECSLWLNICILNHSLSVWMPALLFVCKHTQC
jgi:hypothetical protein